MNPNRWLTPRKLLFGGVLVVAAVTAMVLLGSSSGRGTAGKAQAAQKDTSNTKSAKAEEGKKNKKNGKDKADEPVPTAVELAMVRRGSITTWLPGTSALEPRNAAALVSETSGRVIRLMCEEGDRVPAGAVLAEIDDREARLAVERTQIAAETAKREAERGESMKSQGYLSDREIEDLQLRRRQAWVAYEEARLDLARTKITAPFTGRVAARTVQLGETVIPGRECFRVVDESPLLARLYLPERELSQVRVGQSATVALESAPGLTWPARVTLVNPVVDQAHGTFKVTLEVPNARGTIRPGSFARIRLQAGHVDGALLVPRRGVLEEDGDTFVFVARGDSAVRVPVRLGVQDRDTVQVLHGLAAGERVVTVGHGGLKPGSRIKAATL